MTKDLRQRAAKAFLWDFAGIFAKQGIALVVSIFLARLVGPTEFGLVALAMVFISLSQVFADFGFASALIQNKDNTSLTYSSIFYVNIVAGLALFIFFWLVAPLIGAFYDNRDVGTILRWLSLSFILSSFNQVQQTILKANIQFKKITSRAVIAQTSSGLIAVFLAFRGWGVYALVVQNLAGTLINTLILWRVAEWYPKLEFSWTEVKKLTGFSIYVFFSHVLNKLMTQLDTLVVGKIFSPTTLGFYNRAASLNSLVTMFSASSLSKVGFPVLSKISDDKERFERIYFQLLEMIGFTSFALSGCLLFAGKDIIITLFGEQWVPSIFIFQILVLKAFTYPTSLLIVSTFLAAGKSKENFWFGSIRKAVALLPLVIAIFWDFTSFLYGVLFAGYLNWILNNWFVTLSFNISLVRQCKVILTYLLSFTAISAAVYLSSAYLDFPFAGILRALVFLLMYLAVNLLLRTRGYIYFFDNMLTAWKELRKKAGKDPERIQAGEKNGFQ